MKKGGIYMEVEKIFNLISKKMDADFQIAKQAQHNSNIGGFREKVLKNFLEDGRLPSKYAIGSGEVVSPFFGHSKQVDLIIYDKQNTPLLNYGEDSSIYPIEGVYGIIEVKSKLSKHKLIEGLENIAAFKKLIKPGIVNRHGGRLKYRASEQFGILFAYDLSSNSTQSLLENYIEWAKDKDPKLYPNLIVILNKGVIYTSTLLKTTIDTSDLLKNKFNPSKMDFEERSLFEFYKLLYDQLVKMELSNVNFEMYKDKVCISENSNYHVKERKLIISKDGKEYTYKTYSEDFLKDVITKSYPKKYSSILKESYPNTNFAWDLEENDFEVMYFDPENLPPFNLQEALKKDGCKKMKGSTNELYINGVRYLVEGSYLEPDKFYGLKEII